MEPKKPKSVKLEMTQEELNMQVYLLGAIDLRNDPQTVKLGLGLREKLKNALEVFKPKNKPKRDKYGKVITEEDLAKATTDPEGSEGSPEGEQPANPPSEEPHTEMTSEESYAQAISGGVEPSRPVEDM